jgi:DNA-binding PadR family transcriptional regulator
MSYAGVESEDDYQDRRRRERDRATYEISPAGRAKAAKLAYDNRMSMLQGRLAHMQSTIAQFTEKIPQTQAEIESLRERGPQCNGCGLNPCELHPGCNYQRERAKYPGVN